MKVEIIKQFSVFMPNQPGALARLAKAFADANINIVGIASEVREESGVVRIAIEEHDTPTSVLSKAGFASVESNLLSVELEDKPGQLTKVTQILADGGINILTVYGTSFGRHLSRILISVENAAEAAALLEKAS